MKFKSVLILTILLLSYGNGMEFSLLQKDKEYKGDEVTINKAPFTIASTQKEFAFVLSTKPIKRLEKKKTILKLIGSGEALLKGDAPLYRPSSLLDNYQTCRVYYGNIGKGCESYIKEKVSLGFKDEPVYTFGAFYVEPKEWLVKSIRGKEISKRDEPLYYLYLFEEEDRVGEVAVIQHITRIKINME